METRFWNLPPYYRYTNSHFARRSGDNLYGYGSDRSGPVYSQFPSSSTTPPKKYPSRMARERTIQNIWRTVTGFTLLGILFGLSIGAAIFISVHLSIKCDDSSDDSTQSAVSTENKLVIPGQATRDDWTFTDDLLDPNSEEFKDMQETFCSLVASEIALGNLQSSYEDCAVKNFSEGSVIVAFDLTVFKMEQTDNDQIYQAIIISLSVHFTRFELLPNPETLIGVDNCDGNNCENGAVCLDYLDSYICICPANYWGELCQSECDPCQEVTTCANNDVTSCAPCEPCDVTTPSPDVPCTPCPDCETTTCSPTPEVTTCEPCSNCTTEVPTGPTPANFCDPNPCLRGECLSHSTGYHCICPEYYFGDNCSQEITQHCAGQCMNNGSCFEDQANDSFFCKCLDGWTGETCDTEVRNLCDPNPCARNVTCLTDELNSEYFCVCEPSYTGINCTDLLTDPCANHSCESGGTCAPLDDSYICLCPPTHTDENCTTLIQNPCDTSPCHENATCTFPPGDSDTYYCICPPEMTGVNCTSLVILPCDAEPCGLHGSCLDLYNGAYQCNCDSGYEGENCTVNVTLPCDSSPCNSTGLSACLNLENGNPLCLCNTGFTGSDCSDPIPSVCDLENPCQNGRCEVAEYKCTCDAGFEGENCTDEVNNPCEPNNPCQNEGICHWLEDGTHLCDCPNQYMGENCTVNATICLPATCENNGTCYDLLDGDFFCDCTTGYSGKNCSEPAVSCPDEYTYVAVLGCFVISESADYGYGAATEFCGRISSLPPDSILNDEGSLLTGYNIDQLETIAVALGRPDDPFWLEDTPCHFYDGTNIDSSLTPGECHSDTNYKLVVCKWLAP